MQRDTLRAVLERIEGLDVDGKTHRCREGHQVTLFLGELGRGMVVSNVQSLCLEATHAEIVAKDRGTLLVPLEAISGVQCVENEPKGAKRAGVGFNG